MTKNIVKSLTPSVKAGGHGGGGGLFHRSLFNVIFLLCKHYSLFSSFFLFKSRYEIANVDLSTATAEWIVNTYAQRNWIEVFYREAKGWLGLKEYQGAR
jgi:hypothetical protein